MFDCEISIIENILWYLSKDPLEYLFMYSNKLYHYKKKALGKMKCVYIFLKSRKSLKSLYIYGCDVYVQSIYNTQYNRSFTRCHGHL